MVERFKTPLAERLRLAEVRKRRYWNDPEHRLQKLNVARAWQGLPPRNSVDEIQTRGPRS